MCMTLTAMYVLPSVLGVDSTLLSFRACFVLFRELVDNNYLLYGNALLRREPGSDGGDDSGAVAAGVGGGQDQEGGGDDEGLQVD